MNIVAQSKWFSIADANGNDEVILSGDEVIVVARDEHGRVLLIEEPAFAFSDTALQLPGGTVKKNEDIVAAGLRELREETGFAARTLKLMGALRPWSKYLQVTSHVVYAEDLYLSPLKPDEAHQIPVHPRGDAEIAELIFSGELNDARVLAALGICSGEGLFRRTLR